MIGIFTSAPIPDVVDGGLAVASLRIHRERQASSLTVATPERVGRATRRLNGNPSRTPAGQSTGQACRFTQALELHNLRAVQADAPEGSPS